MLLPTSPLSIQRASINPKRSTWPFTRVDNGGVEPPNYLGVDDNGCDPYDPLKALATKLLNVLTNYFMGRLPCSRRRPPLDEFFRSDSFRNLELSGKTDREATDEPSRGIECYSRRTQTVACLWVQSVPFPRFDPPVLKGWEGLAPREPNCCRY